MKGKPLHKILVSQRKPPKSKNIKDLDGFSIKNGSETGQSREGPKSNSTVPCHPERSRQAK